MKYRHEIDGLRGLAVLSVILYHAKLVVFDDVWFQGGYIGVDIFFVISGYLISRLILWELYENEKFNIVIFYDKRIRRIFPVFLVVLITCTFFASFKLLPLELVEFGKSALSAIGFVSNFFFYYSSTIYGSITSLEKPLLHTWSLGIEEQFYMIAPVIAIMCWKYIKKYLLIFILVTFLISLIFAHIFQYINPNLNFYFPISRFWQLIMGSGLAFFEIYNRNEKILLKFQHLSFLGLCLILLSIFFFKENTPHPSFYTLIPVFGVALVIMFSSKHNIVGKILCSKPLLNTGLISYSLYLWHFPIFAFIRAINSKEPSNFEKVEYIVLTFIISIISYIIIEKPLRNRNLVPTKTFYLFIFILISTVVISNSILIYHNGFPKRLPIWAVTKQKPWNKLIINDKVCFGKTENFCTFFKNSKLPTILTIGDSHMASIEYDLVKRYNKKFNFITASMPGCPMFLKHSRFQINTNKGDNCTSEYQNKRLKLIKNTDNPIIVLYSRLPLYITKSDFKDYAINNKNHSSEFRDLNGKIINFETAMSHTINELSKITKNIIIITPTPEFGINPASILINKYTFNELKISTKKKLENIHYDINIFLNHVKSSMDIINVVKDKAIILNSSSVFCNTFSKNKCTASDNKVLFFADRNHLSMQGAKLLNDKLVNKIENKLLKNKF